MATWNPVGYNAADFTVPGAAAWTVDAGDVNMFEYTVSGKMMTVSFYITNTSVTRNGADPAQLQIKIPGGKTATHLPWLAVLYYIDNGTRGVGFMQINGSATRIDCFIQSAGQWAAAVNTTAVFGQITFETT